MKYRVDFSRLARTADEAVTDKMASDLVDLLLRQCGLWASLGGKKLKLADGHIIDKALVDGEPDLNGQEVLERHIKPKFPEAVLLSWDQINDSDPVHLRDGKWWFWDEVWVDERGPFDTRDEARKACIKYAETL